MSDNKKRRTVRTKLCLRLFAAPFMSFSFFLLSSFFFFLPLVDYSPFGQIVSANNRCFTHNIAPSDIDHVSVNYTRVNSHRRS